MDSIENVKSVQNTQEALDLKFNHSVNALSYLSVIDNLNSELDDYASDIVADITGSVQVVTLLEEPDILIIENEIQNIKDKELAEKPIAVFIGERRLKIQKDWAKPYFDHLDKLKTDSGRCLSKDNVIEKIHNKILKDTDKDSIKGLNPKIISKLWLDYGCTPWRNREEVRVYKKLEILED